MEMTTPDLNSTLLKTWGLSGKVFSPAPLVHPQNAVIVMGGSEGGMHEGDAQALAQAGFTVLALAYFGAPGVPTNLHDIPLEYFSRAVDLLISLGAVPGSIGMLGGSFGGEADILTFKFDKLYSHFGFCQNESKPLAARSYVALSHAQERIAMNVPVHA